MAIAPNTTFVSGAILTASQQNAFGFGVVAYAKVTASDLSITTTEEIQVTSSTFTAIANRYYKITYYDPQITTSATGFIISYLRLTNLAGTTYQNSIIPLNTLGTIVNSTVTTLTAGSTVIVGTLQSYAGTGSATRSATNPAWILVEDIGPA
jgi:hypothetical protein